MAISFANGPNLVSVSFLFIEEGSGNIFRNAVCYVRIFETRMVAKVQNLTGSISDNTSSESYTDEDQLRLVNLCSKPDTLNLGNFTG